MAALRTSARPAVVCRVRGYESGPAAGERKGRLRVTRYALGVITSRLMSSVLYVDDEPVMRQAVHLWLSTHGIAVHTAKNVASARRCFALHPDVVGAFIDIWLGDGSGFELYAWIEEHRPALVDRVIFVTGDVVAAPAADQIAALGCPVVTKPFDLEEMAAQARAWGAGKEPGARG
jgi:DNA-binding NtrC family response regulator